MLDSCGEAIEPSLELDVGLNPGANEAEPGAVVGDEPGAAIGDEPGAGAGVEPGAGAGVEPGADEGVDVMSLDDGVVDEFRGVEVLGVEFDGALVEFWPSATDPLLGLGVAKLPLLLTHPMGIGWSRIGAIRLDPSAAKLVANVLMLLASVRLRRRGA